MMHMDTRRAAAGSLINGSARQISARAIMMAG